MAKKTIHRKVDKTIDKASRLTKKSGKEANRMVSEISKTVKKGTYKCEICGEEIKGAVAALAHLLDHGSSALEEINTLINNQKEGRVSRKKEQRPERRYKHGEEDG